MLAESQRLAYVCGRMSDAESNLLAAERVALLLVENGAPAVVIGAVALAAHRYVRHTEDIDWMRCYKSWIEAPVN